ncbi:MAG: hypothetical protein WBH55_09015, partial [Bacteroidota bacterium]
MKYAASPRIPHVPTAVEKSPLCVFQSELLTLGCPTLAHIFDLLSIPNNLRKNVSEGLVYV